MEAFERKLTDWLMRKIKDYGIVVWYDPEEIYSNILNTLELGTISLFQFNGSFFELRYRIEPFLKEDHKPQILIYVPLARNDTHYALIEAECAGCYIMPDHMDKEFNTSLAVRFLDWYNTEFQSRQLNDILQKIKSGQYKIDDIIKIIKEQYGAPQSTLSLIYNHLDPFDILTSFLLENQKDKALLKKNGLVEIKSLIEDLLGMKVNADWSVEETRKQLFTTLLISEFVYQAQIQPVPQNIAQWAECEKETFKENRLKAITTLREQRKSTTQYSSIAREVQQNFALEKIPLKYEQLIRAETFPFIELRKIEYGFNLIIEENVDNLADLSRQKTQNNFWAEQLPFNVFWNWLQNAAHFFEVRCQIIQKLKNNSWNLETFFKEYTDPDNGWWRLDQVFRFLEDQYAVLELDILSDIEVAEKSRTRLQQLYKDTLYELAEYFQTLINKQGYTGKNLLYQRQIFKQIVQPQIDQSKRIAYFFVDALRFELAMSLAKALQNIAEVEVQSAVGQLPAITPIGMAALLPGADGPIKLINTNKKLGLVVNGNPLFTRADRLNYIKDQLSDKQVLELKLEQIRTPSKRIQEKINQANIIIVTAQEFDQLGEKFDPSIARHLMEEILNTLRIAVHNLVKLGIDYLLVTADHGYLFGNDLLISEKIDEPGGQKVGLHRRVWVGKGGKSHPSYLAFKESNFGLDGDLELIFPANIACFKAPGGNEVYYHGGLSLQELALPVIMVKQKERATQRVQNARIIVELEPLKITNRLFTIKITYSSDDMFAPKKITVQVALQHGSQPAGVVRLASYGFDQSSNDIVLQLNKSNLITLQLEKDDVPHVDLLITDPQSMQILKRIGQIPVELLI